MGTGTPTTGRSVHAATTQGRCAAPAAAAITTLRPRCCALLAHSMTPAGSRCAEQILSSVSMSNSASCLRQDSISWRSDFEPRMTPTSGTYRLQEAVWGRRLPSTPGHTAKRASRRPGATGRCPGTSQPRAAVLGASSHPDPLAAKLDVNPKPPPVQCPSERKLPKIVRAPLLTTPPCELDRSRPPFPPRSARGHRK